MSAFTWTPDFSSQMTHTPNVSLIQFGDGYSQRVATGINTTGLSWDLQFTNRAISEADDIDNFLKAANAVQSFDWTPPRASASIKVICQTWTRTPNNAAFDSLEATFMQVFEP